MLHFKVSIDILIHQQFLCGEEKQQQLSRPGGQVPAVAVRFLKDSTRRHLQSIAGNCAAG